MESLKYLQIWNLIFQLIIFIIHKANFKKALQSIKW